MGGALEIALYGRPGQRGGGIILPGSLVLDARDTWYDAPGGSFLTMFNLPTEAWTVEYWVKLPYLVGPPDPGSRFLVENMEPAGGANATWGSRMNESAGIGFHTFTCTANFPGGTHADYGPLLWVHIAIAWAPPPAGVAGEGRMRQWRNGVALGEVDPLGTSGPSTAGAGFRVGDQGTSNGFAGVKYAEIRCWDHGRSTAQIIDNMMLAIPPASAGLEALYVSENAAGGTLATVPDEAGANDLTRQNAANSSFDPGDVPF